MILPKYRMSNAKRLKFNGVQRLAMVSFRYNVKMVVLTRELSNKVLMSIRTK